MIRIPLNMGNRVIDYFELFSYNEWKNNNDVFYNSHDYRENINGANFPKIITKSTQGTLPVTISNKVNDGFLANNNTNSAPQWYQESMFTDFSMDTPTVWQGTCVNQSIITDFFTGTNIRINQGVINGKVNFSITFSSTTDPQDIADFYKSNYINISINSGLAFINMLLLGNMLNNLFAGIYHVVDANPGKTLKQLCSFELNGASSFLLKPSDVDISVWSGPLPDVGTFVFGIGAK